MTSLVTTMKQPRGSVANAIIEFLRNHDGDAKPQEIHAAIEAKLGKVAQTSVRSYLRLNTPEKFERTAYGRYD